MAIGPVNFGVGTALRGLNASTRQSNTALGRISSGLKINQGADNPAGLIISELLRSQASATSRALQNTTEAYNVMGIAEGGLASIQSNLESMRSLAIHSLNSGITSSGQTAANQSMMDSLLTSVQHTADTTNYAGQKLLDGSQSATYGLTDPDQLLASVVVDHVAQNGTDVTLTYAGGTANQAEKAHLETNFNNGSATLAEDQMFTVSGESGTYTFAFQAGTRLDDVAAVINTQSDRTGVTAYGIQNQGDGATELRLVSDQYGANASVRVDQRQGDAFAGQGSVAYDQGQDARLSVNGRSVLTDGLTARIADADLRATFQLNAGDTNTPTLAQTGYDQDTLTDASASAAVSLTNVQGGMQLQLGGGSHAADRTTASLPDASTRALGQVTVDGKSYSLDDLRSGGAASLANDPVLALQVIDQAIKDVAGARANVGAFQAHTLETNANNLAIEFMNLTASESAIRDADIAAEITDLTSANLLQQMAMRMIRKANEQSQMSVASLLGGAGRTA